MCKFKILDSKISLSLFRHYCLTGRKSFLTLHSSEQIERVEPSRQLTDLDVKNMPPPPQLWQVALEEDMWTSSTTFFSLRVDTSHERSCQTLIFPAQTLSLKNNFRGPIKGKKKIKNKKNTPDFRRRKKSLAGRKTRVKKQTNTKSYNFFQQK